MTFDLEVLDGSPGEFVASHQSPPSSRIVSVCRPSTGAVVLGSSQPATDSTRKFAKQHGLELVTRSSGGAGVLVVPGNVVWIDIGLPKFDPLISSDLSRSFDFIASAWQSSLSAFGARDLVAHRGGMHKSKKFPDICFAGLGPGELTWFNKKLVGMAQRKRTHGAYFHTMAYVDFPYLPSIQLFSDIGSTGNDELGSLVTDLRSVFHSQVIPDDVVLGKRLAEELSLFANQ